MKSAILVILASTTIATFGCATTAPTFGDRIKADGESTVAIAEQWEAGASLLKKGEKQVNEGHKKIANGRADLRDGEQLIIAGNIAVETNRQSYQALAQIAQGTTEVDIASDRANKLKKYAVSWEEGEDNIVKGTALIKRGNNRLTEGESDIKKGQKLVETGRMKMQDAELSYRP